jgi:site-specific DNA recombinase
MWGECRLDVLYETGSVEQKRKIIGSIFPDKLIFGGEDYRTAGVNEGARVVFAIDEVFRQKENGTNLSFEDLSHQVIPLGEF